MRTVLNYTAEYEEPTPSEAYASALAGKDDIPFEADEVKIMVEEYYDPDLEEGGPVWRATVTALGTVW